MDVEPRLQNGFWCWPDREGGVAVCFSGRPETGEDLQLESALRALLPRGVRAAWLRQVHSADVLTAAPGCAGRGDALVSSRMEDLALAIVTADCVPVLLAGGGRLAAVHAGWRGIAGGVVPAAVERLVAAPLLAAPLLAAPLLAAPLMAAPLMAAPLAAALREEVLAWIGPAIGRCCYEVGEDVARQIAAASAPEVVCPGVVRPGAARPGAARPGAAGPHLDLRHAVEVQLAAAGVTRVRHVDRCTRCDAERLWSYRREGRAAGRNLALIYRRPG